MANGQPFVALGMLKLKSDADYTRAKISQAITGLLLQQPCNNTVNMIEQGW